MMGQNLRPAKPYKSSMFGLSCSKFGLKISGSCSKCSKFGVSMFEVFSVRYFGVRSTSSSNQIVVLILVYNPHIILRLFYYYSHGPDHLALWAHLELFSIMLMSIILGLDDLGFGHINSLLSKYLRHEYIA